ncbi:MAG: 6,7-dimethyl-8-ribityllumazine synthase [bacterium]|nr:6,7-dimethyl-8-ribityllumazine synthase [bacterium]
MAPRISIIAAQFNPEIVEPMILVAQETLLKEGVQIIDIIRVPGSYEIPLATSLLLKKDNTDAIIVLGYIEKGETLHGEVMGHVVHQSIVQLQLQYSIPIAIGIIGPGATLEQATERNREYAIEAAQCAIQMVEVANQLKK